MLSNTEYNLTHLRPEWAVKQTGFKGWVKNIINRSCQEELKFTFVIFHLHMTGMQFVKLCYIQVF